MGGLTLGGRGLPSCRVFTWPFHVKREKDRQGEISRVSLPIRALIPSRGPHSKPNYLSSPQHDGVKASTDELGEGGAYTNIQSLTGTLRCIRSKSGVILRQIPPFKQNKQKISE